MQRLQDDYLTAYRSLRLTRDANGVLVAEFHSNGGPLTFTAQAHTEVVDAFYRIAQDRANKMVILTGAGGDFIIGVDWSSFDDVADPGVWSQIHDEGDNHAGAKRLRRGEPGDSASGLHWFIDHAETISQRNMDRIAAVGGGIAIQHRMAFQGEYFRDRYGSADTKRTPPI